MPYPDNFNSAAFAALFAGDDRVKRDDVSFWLEGLMGRMKPQFDALLSAVKADYVYYLGTDAPGLELSVDKIADMVREMICDDVAWGDFDD